MLKPGGVLAAWTYGIHHIDDSELNVAVRHFYHKVVGPFWPPERHHVETG